MSGEKYLIIIGGPTASGKTNLAIHLAQHYATAIVSCDSRQFFKEMQIGTARPTDEELNQAPHHFIGHLSIFQDYNVGDFERDALQLLEKLFEAHDVVILVGGSGLYIKALCEGLDEFPDVNPEIREEWNTIYQEQGIEPLQKALKKNDPTYYKIVDQQNPKRLIRALSVYQASGIPYSQFLSKPKAKRFFQPIYLYLDWDRPILYERINQRVDHMMEVGLLEEARALYPNKHLNALQTVGYSELFDFFDGKTRLEEAVALIKQNTRRYAKRQLTWLRRDGFWKAFPPKQLEACIQYIEQEKNN